MYLFTKTLFIPYFNMEGDMFSLFGNKTIFDTAGIAQGKNENIL